EAGARIRSRFLRWVCPDAGLSAHVPETHSPARRADQLESALPRRRDARLPRFAVCRRCLAHGCDRRRRYRDERAALTAAPSRLLSPLRPVKLRPLGEENPWRTRPARLPP